MKSCLDVVLYTIFVMYFVMYFVIEDCQGARGPVRQAVRTSGGPSHKLSGRQGACLGSCQDARGPVWEAVRMPGACLGG